MSSHYAAVPESAAGTFPFDGWRHGRTIAKGDLCAKGENDPIRTNAPHETLPISFGRRTHE
jgi:hypothetical protein